jgi:hypothetical protein
MGLQGNVGPRGANSHLNAGFSIVARGPSAKAVLDVDPKADKKFSARPSVNLSVDFSAYATVFPLRFGPYFEMGRFAAGKPKTVLDKLDVAINPEYLTEVGNAWNNTGSR